MAVLVLQFVIAAQESHADRTTSMDDRLRNGFVRRVSLG
jgi:hypothetical protein